MKIEINRDDGWAEVDLTDQLIGKNFWNQSYSVTHRVETELGLERGTLQVTHCSRFVVGIVYLAGRKCILQLYQHTRLRDNTLPRNEWDFDVEMRADVKVHILTPGMYTSGTDVYLYHSPSMMGYKAEDYRAAEIEAEKECPNCDGDVIQDMAFSKLNAISKTRFNLWYDQMAAEIKQEAADAAYIQDNLTDEEKERFQ